MNLLEFVSGLRVQQDVLDIGLKFDPRLELSALTDWVCKRGGPALRFQQIAGSEIETVTNLFGSERRMAAALGHERLDAFGSHLSSELAQCQTKNSAQGLTRLLSLPVVGLAPNKLNPRTDLGFLPDFRFWPAEQRSFFTLAVVLTQDPVTAKQNYGIYRVGLAGAKRLTLNLLPRSGGATHLRHWKRRQQKMPVAILLGADPALIFAAAASLPSDCNEAGLSSWIQSKPLEFMACRTVPMNCPLSTQVLIEGWLDPAETMNEGPFGCYTGSYGGGNLCPVVEVTSVASVDCPLISQTLAGPLPMEDSWLAQANFEILQARLRVDLPQIKALEMPLDAAFHGLYFVSDEGDGIQVSEIALELRKFDYLKHMKMLVLLEKGEIYDEKNWRDQVQKKSIDRIWKENSVPLEALLNNQPPKLCHDAALLESVLNRLKRAGLNMEKICAGGK